MDAQKVTKERARRVPIRRRVLMSLLITMFVALILAFSTSLIIMLTIRGESEKVLSKSLERNFAALVEQKADTTDLRLEKYGDYLRFVSDYVTQMYGDREALIAGGRFVGAPDPSTPPDVYAMTSTMAYEDLTFEDMRDEIYFFSNLEKVLAPISHENKDVITTMYLGTDNGYLPSYDRWSCLSETPKGETEVYNYFESEWYQTGMQAEDVFFTSLYTDVMGRGLTITIGCPYKDTKGVVRGVAAADFDITGLYNEMISLDLGEGSYSFVINQDKEVISLDSTGVTATRYTGLSEESVSRITSGISGVLETDSGFYVYAPLSQVPWVVCAYVPSDIVLSSVQEVDRTILYSIFSFIAGTLIIIVLSFIVANRLARSITYPMELLGQDMQIIAEDNLDHESRPYRNDEIGDMSIRLNDMVARLKQTLTKLKDTEEQADAMAELASRDSLTGIRNKTAYDKYIESNKETFLSGDEGFGFVMIDLNYLKKTNDTYGHDKGNISIIKLCKTVCEIFDHSPVFRIGGDEFIVVLKGRDYGNIEKLMRAFHERTAGFEKDASLQPWEKVSAAIGYALYDKEIDNGIEDVFKRADEAMYECKTSMRAHRE
ncbi:MAG: diguanylate cyclase [Lachnospiraceae bacterium]|nr:diguanylate cyclase [Lachnospiraceae bacterium]